MTTTEPHPYCMHHEGEACHCDAEYLRPAKRGPRVPAVPTEHQATVARLTGDGLTAREIADRLGIGQRGVERLRQAARHHQMTG